MTSTKKKPSKRSGRKKEFKLPTLRQCEKAFGSTTEGWKGNCFAVAKAINEKLKLGLMLRYGHWTGPIAEGSQFAGRRAAGFTHHGWLEFPDGRILDPTRWVFEDVEPYLYLGPSDHYDPGGNRMQKLINEEVRKKKEAGEIPRMLHPMPLQIKSDEVRSFLYDICEKPPEEFTWEDTHLVAHMDPADLGDFAKEIYEAIIAIKGGSALIPIDNRQMVLGGCY